MYRRRRPFLMALLAVGAFAGFASGFASMNCHHADRQAAFEQHIADVCVAAADRAKAGK